MKEDSKHFILQFYKKTTLTDKDLQFNTEPHLKPFIDFEFPIGDPIT